MYTNYPNKEERNKLQKMAGSYQHRSIIIIGLLGIGWIIFDVLDRYFRSPTLLILITALIFIAFVYWALDFALFKRCPRCSAWGTPVMKGGNCPKCGLHLDSSCKES
jgi:hypothetical protein